LTYEQRLKPYIDQLNKYGYYEYDYLKFYPNNKIEYDNGKLYKLNEITFSRSNVYQITINRKYGDFKSIDWKNKLKKLTNYDSININIDKNIDVFYFLFEKYIGIRWDD